MVRSVLKPHATLFAAILRICDPALTVLVGFAGYRAYLGSFEAPEHYQLFMAAGTVKVHLSHAYAKLEVANRTELAAAVARRRN